MNRATLPWMSVLFLSLAPAFVKAEPLLNEQAMSARIDQLLSDRWADKEIKPAARTDDAEFFRRLSIDLNGRIPSLTLIKDFLDDTRPNKRQIWVNKLMDGRDPDFKKINKRLPDLYANHFTNFWRTVIFAQTSNRERAHLAFNLDPWLRRALKENLPYDRMVVEFLTGQGQPFFQANDNKPEYIAGNAARLFLGVKLECAQCHEDRSGPDGKGYWTRDQFWQYAAFFKGGQPLPPKIDIPGSRRVIEAQFLDGQKPAWKNGDNPRVVLARWMTSPENPYFARATVNRMWHYFFGIGLTDPVDFMGTDDNPPSHPELLDELARQFAAHHFDIRYLIRAITGTQAYQRTSARSDASQDDLRLFARMGPRGQSAEQLFDSVLQATGQGNSMPAFTELYGRTNPRIEFLGRFANTSDKRTGTQTSTLQALYLMNSKFVAQTMECEGGSLESIAGAQVPMARRIQELYLTTLSRKPRADEVKRLRKYLGNDLSAEATRKALADIFWALLNSPEFLLNH